MKSMKYMKFFLLHYYHLLRGEYISPWFSAIIFIPYSPYKTHKMLV